ncbi:mucin-6-like [Bolinopsis microptera]|uniref:mucin-6-like n=1 Tax=Bolinopsis microptera TaxID=2820187 RepID=UPI003079A343
MAERTFLALLFILVSLITLAYSHDPCDCIDDLKGTEVTDELPAHITESLVFLEELYDMQRRIGRTAVLSCKVRGEPPLNLYIYHDIIATYKQKLKQKKRNLPCDTIYDPLIPDEVAIRYEVDILEAKHEGVYKCQAESINGDIAVSVMTLTLTDPCEGKVCGFREKCVNIKGAGKCTCDFPCEISYEPICAEERTFCSMCHAEKLECRVGQHLTNIVNGTCDGVQEVPLKAFCGLSVGDGYISRSDNDYYSTKALPTEATCTFSGEGHVTKFNGDYFTFKGACPYKMAEDSRGRTFIVYAKTETCGVNEESTCLKSITMYVDRIYGFSIERGWLINDNGRRKNVLKGERIILGNGAVSITRVGKTLVGRIENKKIEFVYDGLNYFKLSVPLDFVSRPDNFDGFCGTIPLTFVPGVKGRDISNDPGLTIPALSDKCAAPQFGAPTCDNPEIPSQVREAFTNNMAVASCVEKIPITTYLERAIQDTCSCDHRSDHNYCFCNVLFSYLEDCRQDDVDVDVSFADVEDLCRKSFHKDVFKSEGISFYNRGRLYKSKK